MESTSTISYFSVVLFVAYCFVLSSSVLKRFLQEWNGYLLASPGKFKTNSISNTMHVYKKYSFLGRWRQHVQREREKHSKRDRQTDKQRKRDGQKERERQRMTDKEWDRKTKCERRSHTDKERQLEKGILKMKIIKETAIITQKPAYLGTHL